SVKSFLVTKPLLPSDVQALLRPFLVVCFTLVPPYFTALPRNCAAAPLPLTGAQTRPRIMSVLPERHSLLTGARPFHDIALDGGRRGRRRGRGRRRTGGRPGPRGRHSRSPTAEQAAADAEDIGVRLHQGADREREGDDDPQPAHRDTREVDQEQDHGEREDPEPLPR